MFKLRQFALLCLLFLTFSGCTNDTNVKTYLGSNAKLLAREENAELYDTIDAMMKKQYELQFGLSEGYGTSDTLTALNGEKEKNYYLFEYDNVHNWADFEACLAEVYDETYITSLRSRLTEGDSPQFVDYEGELYRRCAGTGIKAVNSDKIQLYRITTDTLALVSEEPASVFNTYLSEYIPKGDETEEIYIYILYLKQNTEKPYGYEIMSR